MNNQELAAVTPEFISFVETNYKFVQSGEMSEKELVEWTHKHYPAVPISEIEYIVYVTLFSANNACWSY